MSNKTTVTLLLPTILLSFSAGFSQTQITQGIVYTYDASGNRIHRAPATSGQRKANPNPGKEEKQSTYEVVTQNNLQASFTPNPTISGNFNVTVSRNASTSLSIKQQTENPEIFVYNPLGELIQQKSAQYDNPVYIDLSSLSKGVYLVKVQSGEERVMKRVVYQ